MLRRIDGALPRLTLSVASAGCPLKFRRSAKAFLDETRRARLALSRRADDCRLPPLGFECLAKVSVVKDLTETFDPLPLRAGKTRGAVPAGQEFVFANLRCHRG